MKCKIQVERILFPKRSVEAGDFCIFTAKVKEVIEGPAPVVSEKFNTVTLKGTVPFLSEGDVFTATLGLAEQNNYGTSYNLLSLTKGEIKLEGEGLIDFLKVIAGEGVGYEMSKVENIFELLQNKNDAELLKIKGVGEKRLKSIYRKFDRNSDRAYALSKLVPLGITPNKVETLCNYLKSGEAVVDMCFNNPYNLLDKIKGLGFQSVDDIAKKCGYGNELVRIKYAIIYTLKTEGENGRSWLWGTQLIESLSNLLVADFDSISAAVNELKAIGGIYLSADGFKVCLPEYYELESKIVEELLRIKNADTLIECPRKWREKIKEIEESQGWKHTDEQLRGIEECLKQNIVAIYGLAGTGKSTVTNAVTSILSDSRIVMACLSAKASQRLREVTGLEAYTIHRLLNTVDNSKDEKLDADIVIVDEASMVNGDLMLKLLSSIKTGAKIFFLGDIGQLTAIGNCSVFSDLISSNEITSIQLTEIHRQAKDSAIITDSRSIRNQQAIYPRGFRGHIVKGKLNDLEILVDDKEKLQGFLINSFMKELDSIGNILEIQIIVPTKNRGEMSVFEINKAIQELLIKKTPLKAYGRDGCEIFVGDKVINTKNNYKAELTNGKKVGVFNGNIGVVRAILSDHMVVDFVGIGPIVVKKEYYRDISLAYAITVHSSQGSQWRRVIMGFDMSSYKLLNVEIVYTGITRGMEKSIIVVEPKAMAQAIRTVEQKYKQTFLCEMLQ